MMIQTTGDAYGPSITPQFRSIHAEDGIHERPMRGTATIRPAAALYALALAALLAGCVPIHPEEQRARSGLLTRTRASKLPGESPIPNAARVSLDQAVALSSLPVYRPDHARASDESVTDAWVSSTRVAIAYDSGLALLLGPSQIEDRVALYERLQAEGVPGSIRQINGVQAFVVPAENQIGAPGSVNMVLNGIEVDLIGHGEFTTDELVEIASSVRASSQPAPQPTPTAP